MLLRSVDTGTATFDKGVWKSTRLLEMFDDAAPGEAADERYRRDVNVVKKRAPNRTADPFVQAPAHRVSPPGAAVLSRTISV